MSGHHVLRRRNWTITSRPISRVEILLMHPSQAYTNCLSGEAETNRKISIYQKYVKGGHKNSLFLIPVYVVLKVVHQDVLRSNYSFFDLSTRMLIGASMQLSVWWGRYFNKILCLGQQRLLALPWSVLQDSPRMSCIVGELCSPSPPRL